MNIIILLDNDMSLVQCRATTDCTGNFTTMTARQCCVENIDGLSFTINGDLTCHVCIGKRAACCSVQFSANL